MKNLTVFLFATCFFLSCSKQQARKPVSYTNSTFLKESIDRNKKLIAKEESLIATFIAQDTLQSYHASTKGYWYKYNTKSTSETPFPKRGDIAYFEYEIKDLKNNTVYTKEELQPQEYFVDKEDIIIGLRDGIKHMKKGETITFLFPSHKAFGYHGDNNKIGANIPLIYTVTLHDIKPDTNAKN